jgi:hypothetical protein
MTDYKATPEQWVYQERWAEVEKDSDAACLLELRARIEVLESLIKQKGIK